jgi:small-conductance mechanosensitive channel
LGAQQIVRDVLNGFFILVEDQFAVGDEVTIDGIHGVVETMGMRITRIRDDQRAAHYAGEQQHHARDKPQSRARAAEPGGEPRR